MKKKLLGLMVLSTLVVMGCNNGNDQQTQVSAQNLAINVAKDDVKNQIQLPNFVSLVKQVGNTVVNVTAEIPSQNNAVQLDPFADLFGKFGQAIPTPKPQNQIKRSMGSGFIISKDGYILTNSHVVDGAKKITVKTTDKQELEAKLIGNDPKTDIALLKVNANNLPVAKIGDPDKLEVGEWVAAIGAPFGFTNTVTQGIVSAKGRNLPDDSYVPFIQTDVPINPGNSGGPLFNLNGAVVGINSQIYSRSGGYMGISFSIPIDIAMNIAEQLKKFGKAAHGQLGVQVQAVTDGLAKSFGLKSVTGALVAQVIPGSAADKVGVKTGDIILKVDGKDVADSMSLPLMIGSKAPNTEVKLDIYRDHKNITLMAKLKDGQSAVNGNSSSDNDKNLNNADVLKLDKFGITISNLDADDKKQLKITSGVAITATNGVAEMAGLMTGDVILSVNNQSVNNVKMVKELLGNTTTAALLILRNNQQMFVTISVN